MSFILLWQTGARLPRCDVHYRGGEVGQPAGGGGPAAPGNRAGQQRRGGGPCHSAGGGRRRRSHTLILWAGQLSPRRPLSLPPSLANPRLRREKVRHEKCSGRRRRFVRKNAKAKSRCQRRSRSRSVSIRPYTTLSQHGGGGHTRERRECKKCQSAIGWKGGDRAESIRRVCCGDTALSANNAGPMMALMGSIGKKNIFLLKSIQSNK